MLLCLSLLMVTLSLGEGRQHGLDFWLPFDLFSLLIQTDQGLLMRYRAIVPAMLFIGALAALGLQSLPYKWATPIAVLGLFEILFRPQVPLSMEQFTLPPTYAKLSQSPELFGIVEFPCDLLGPEDISADNFALLNQLNQRQLFYQSYHNKGLSLVDKANLSRTVYELPLMMELHRTAYGVAVLGTPKQVDSLSWLKENDYRVLLLHASYLPEDRLSDTLALLTTELGPGIKDPVAQIWQFKISDDSREP